MWPGGPSIRGAAGRNPPGASVEQYPAPENWTLAEQLASADSLAQDFALRNAAGSAKASTTYVGVVDENAGDITLASSDGQPVLPLGASGPVCPSFYAEGNALNAAGTGIEDAYLTDAYTVNDADEAVPKLVCWKCQYDYYAWNSGWSSSKRNLSALTGRLWHVAVGVQPAIFPDTSVDSREL